MGALSRAGRADNADNLAGRNAEADVVQHLRPVDAIAKRHVLECHVATNCRQRGTAWTKGRLRRGIEDVAKAGHGEASLVEVLPHLRQAEHGGTYPSGENIECHQLADRERTFDHKLGAKKSTPAVTSLLMNCTVWLAVLPRLMTRKLALT